ncbi:hypothetical protein DL96DRAFT_1595646 [Flagelloscypha sp. PMI_526]|nr:hypothetical protein DL96DRAFT_1595646 [Flagelloscypha sp. PMI_526]
MDPLFHPDVEREIFEFSAYADPKTMPFTLILVAKHVQQWIEPLIYRHIDLYHKTSAVIPAILAISNARGPNFLTNAVRSISFENLDHNEMPTENLTKLINACPRVKYLGLCGNPFYQGNEKPDLQESIANLEGLTLLGVPFADCFICLTKTRASLGKTSPWSLTHLDLGADHFPPLELLDTDALPCLTHVAFGPFASGYRQFLSSSIPRILEFIESRRHHLFCVWLTGRAWKGTELMDLQYKEAYRRFFVVQSHFPSADEWMDNWNQMVEGVGSMWAPGLRVLERRAQGLKDEEEEDVVQFQFPDIYVGPLNVSEEDEEEEESGEDGEEEDEE